jgi:hypothetical protein
MFHNVSNGTDFVMYMVIIYSKNLIKLYILLTSIKKYRPYSLNPR